MTEINATHADFAPSIESFVLHWGEMGQVWGVNRSVSQVHALLYMSEKPLTADDIAGLLAMARSNVSTSLRELISWGLIRRVQILGDRRDFYEAESDMLEMVRRIALGRKARELDPTIALLRRCASEAGKDRRVSKHVRARFNEMLKVTESVDRAFMEVLRLPRPLFARLIKMGGAVTRLAGATGSK